MNPLRRVLRVSLAALVVLPATASSAQEGPPNPPPFDHVAGGNVTPPGNSGHIPATALPQALAGTHENPNMADQRDLYVAWERKDWSFARPGAEAAPGADPKDALGEPYSPRDGIVIYRDGWGVPRIFGETDADAQFGAGYAMAEDRLFQADIFRHVARGEMAEFIGGQSWYDYDRAWRAEFYTDEELLVSMKRFFTEREQGLLQAYVDGINQYIDEAMRDPTKLPAEYVALALRPEPWELTDSLSIAVLQARDSVEGFGQEWFNASLLRDLTERLGNRQGRRAFSDIRFYRDPGAYTTAPRSEGRFSYPGGGFEGIDARGVALPDEPMQTEELAARDAALLQGLQTVGLGRAQASNAIAVGDRLTAKRDAILLGGPQLAYLVPGIFYEFEIHSPSQHARGVGFAGAAGLILIGKTPTHAWSITYGYTDQVDTFLVPLDPEDETHYLRHGESRPLETYTTTVRCKLNQAGLISPDESDLCDGMPADETELEVRRVPEYGPVVGEVDFEGEPHAVVEARSHWMREVQNGKPFLTFNQATTMEQFRAAQRDFNVSLNVNYVDDRGNAGFWHVARPPIRARGTDVRLPTLGDGRFDWKGFVPLNDIPHAINPAQGYTANWNNQIAAGWHNGDQNYWADLQRVEMLARRMQRLAQRGDITPEDVWQVNREAAFEDGRWHELSPLLRGALREPPSEATAQRARELLLDWDGQRTSSEDDEGVYRYDDPAVAIFDALVASLQQELMSDELDTYYDAFGAETDPDFYAFKQQLLLRILEGRRATLRAEHDWLDGVSASGAIRGAFDDAIGQLESEFGADPESWRAPAFMTTYQAVGLGDVEPHPFMNRGTYNQLAVVKVVR